MNSAWEFVVGSRKEKFCANVILKQTVNPSLGRGLQLPWAEPGPAQSTLSTGSKRSILLRTDLQRTNRTIEHASISLCPGQGTQGVWGHSHAGQNHHRAQGQPLPNQLTDSRAVGQLLRVRTQHRPQSRLLSMGWKLHSRLDAVLMWVATVNCFTNNVLLTVFKKKTVLFQIEILRLLD